MTIGHRLIGRGAQKVIVMPGWFGDHTVFAPMLPYLDGERFTYAFIDYRGYGMSREMAGKFNMQELAGDALALADRQGWQRFHAIGHSMGGKAVERILADGKGRVKSAVAITPVSAAAVPMDAETKELFAGAIESDDNRRAVIDFSSGNRLSPTWLGWMVASSRAQTTQAAFAAYLAAWTGEDFVAAVAGDPTPILVLIGEHDQALTRDVMQQTFLAWHKRAELQVIANAGHYPMQETPVYLATVIEKFMAAHEE